ncbi:hypothetical protein Fot_49837 [Forsythia ovata]|uniref:Uncharacterized protein n=1 Tax=Forsythia ovata TaxID=205694 RepID=A0ABD1QD04_9LAMI
MGIPDNPFAALKKLRPNNDDENYEKQQIIHHHVTLTVNCPSCKKPFFVRANLTDVTTHETGGSNSQHHIGIGEEANHAHKIKHETNKKARNKEPRQAAAVLQNSSKKRGHACVSDSKDDLPVAKKSKYVNPHLNFNN